MATRSRSGRLGSSTTSASETRQKIKLAKQLDQLHRKGVDAKQVLDLAAARKPLPTDHPTSALAYRIRELGTPRKFAKPRASTRSCARLSRAVGRA